MKSNKIDTYLFFTVFLLTYMGYYAILLLLFNLGMSEMTRMVTIPLRLALSAILVLLFFKNIKKLQPIKGINWFLIFCFFYLARLFVEYNNNEPYYMSTTQVFLYFVSFVIIPFIVVSSQHLTVIKLKAIFTSMLIGGVLFSALVVFYYSRFLGVVSRLTSSTAGEEVLSPLALSYTSSLVIGVFVFYLLQNKTNYLKKALLITGIALATAPFFLGSSRGSLIALAIPFILYFFSGKSINFKIQSFLLMATAIIIIVILDEYFKSGLLNRFFGISYAIETGDSRALRIIIWQNSFEQFLDNPIFGDKLRVDGVTGYAHNLFIEVLQTTGIIGFIPFLILVIKAWKTCLYILKNHKPYFWVTVIFIQAFFSNMFSGSLYSAVWFWTGMALLIAIERFLKNNEV